MAPSFPPSQPEIEDAALNKIFYPVGNTFLEHEADRAIFFDLRGGEVVAVDERGSGGSCAESDAEGRGDVIRFDFYEQSHVRR